MYWRVLLKQRLNLNQIGRQGKESTVPVMKTDLNNIKSLKCNQFDSYCRSSPLLQCTTKNVKSQRQIVVLRRVQHVGKKRTQNAVPTVKYGT